MFGLVECEWDECRECLVGGRLERGVDGLV